MKNALGIGMEHSDGGTTVLVLSGILRADSLDELRSRIRALVEDGCKVLLFDLQEAEIRGPEIREFFLEVLNDMRGRGGRVALIARRHDVLAYFASVRNILEIFPAAPSSAGPGWWRRSSGAASPIRKRPGCASRWGWRSSSS